MKVNLMLKQLGEAYTRLVEAVHVDMNAPLAIDGTIQRFEFCFELSWKTLKTVLESEGIVCTSPKHCLKEAFQAQILKSEEGWLTLLEARNLTVHVYDEKMAKRIYGMIQERYSLIGELVESLQQRIAEGSHA